MGWRGGFQLWRVNCAKGTLSTLFGCLLLSAYFVGLCVIMEKADALYSNLSLGIKFHRSMYYPLFCNTFSNVWCILLFYFLKIQFLLSQMGVHTLWIHLISIKQIGFKSIIWNFRNLIVIQFYKQYLVVYSIRSFLHVYKESEIYLHFHHQKFFLYSQLYWSIFFRSFSYRCK